MLPAFFDKTKKLPQAIEPVDAGGSARVVLDFTTPDRKSTLLNAHTGPLGSVETASPLSFILPNELLNTPSSQESITTEGRRHSSEEPIPFVLDHVVIQIPEQTPSIANRIIRNYELRLMSALPAVHEKFNLTTIITPEGVHQLNQELNVFKCLITADEFKAKHGSVFLRRAEYVTAEEGELIHDELTLKELNLLESSIRMCRGHTIIGYSINEEVFLRTLGEYPPAPAWFSKRVLDAISMDIVWDMRVSLRSAALALILFGNLVSAYMQFDVKQKGAYNTFYYNHVFLFLMLTCSVGVMEVLLLRSEMIRRQVKFLLQCEHFEKKEVLTGINRFRLIEESMIGATTNWNTYGSFIGSLIFSESTLSSVIGYGMFPVLLYALRKGYFNEDARHTMSAINIANHTRLKTLWNGLSYALTTGSFFSLGTQYITLDIVFATTTDDVSAFIRFYHDRSYIQYVFCGIALLGHLARYPNAPVWAQQYGRYLSNVSNTMGNAMLDNFAVCVVLSMMLGLMFDNGNTANQMEYLILLYSLESVTLFYNLFVSFSATPDLPEFSMEHNPSEKTIMTLCSQKIEQFKKLISFCNKQEHNALGENGASIELSTQNTTRLGLFPSLDKEQISLSSDMQHNHANPMVAFN